MMRVASFLFLVASCVVALGLGTPISLARLKSASAIATPSTPENLTIDPIAGTEYVLTWESGGAQHGYQVYKSTSGTNNHAFLASTSAATYTDTSSNPSLDTWYKVRATNAPSSFSPFIEAFVPAAPTLINILSVNGTGVTVGWTDNSTNESGYLVYFRYDGGDEFLVNCEAGDDNPTAPSVGSLLLHVDCTPNGNQYDFSFYEFYVIATNSTPGGYSYSSGYIQVPPSVSQTTLSASVNGDDIILTWMPTGENGTVSIYLSDGGAPADLIDSGIIETDGTYTHVLAALLLSMHSLTYHIVTGNSGGSGPGSNMYNITP